VFTGLALACNIGAFVVGQRVSTLKDQIAKERSSEIDRAKKDAADAREEVEGLKERTRQRTLTREQRAQMISSLKGANMNWFEIWGQVGDPESMAFADQLNVLFGEVSLGTQMGILPLTDAPRGVTVRVHRKDNMPGCVPRFVWAAAEIGISVVVVEDPEDPRLNETRAYLIVGSR
jgi:hypothetical protein